MTASFYFTKYRSDVRNYYYFYRISIYQIVLLEKLLLLETFYRISIYHIVLLFIFTICIDF
ncbi:MAG: hypothetical protein ACI8RD_000890 [Bacillariaceae sp.]|jgi:hypothetical protein